MELLKLLLSDNMNLQVLNGKPIRFGNTSRLLQETTEDKIVAQIIVSQTKAEQEWEKVVAGVQKVVQCFK